MTAAPPAAAVVAAGETENERKLRQQLEAAHADKKKAEIIAAEKERENQELKKVHRPAPAPRVKKESWLRPVIGFDDE